MGALGGLRLPAGKRTRGVALSVALGIALGGSVAPYAWAATGGASSGDGALRTEPQVTLVQRLAPPVVLKPLRDPRSRLSAKGTDLWKISTVGDHDIPEAALRAYKNAAATENRLHPACGIPWTLLAGIGRVESDHGRYGGSQLGSDGVPRPAIRGIALDGHGPVAAIRDTDNGRFDGDKVWDRAVGPMQFIPSTWRSSGRDGDGDGVADPNDIDDAALAAADYLCPASGSIRSMGAMRAAIFSYNQSDYYVALVSAFERGYRTGVFSIPSPPPPPGADRPGHHEHHEKHAPKHHGKRPGGHGTEHRGKHGSKHGKGRHHPGHQPAPSGGNGGSTHSPKPDPKPKPHPQPKPSPSPSPSPSGPSYSARTGTLAAAGNGFALDGLALDLGTPGKLGAHAAADYDDDHTVETNAQELAGLVGRRVTVTVQDGTSPALVVAILGQDY